MSNEAPDSIYIIIRLYHDKDAYNYPTCVEEVVSECGFFTKENLAQKVAEGLGPSVEAKLNEEYQAELKAYHKLLNAYERREVELTAIRAANIKPSMASFRMPIKPQPHTRLRERSYITYEVMELDINENEELSGVKP